MRVLPGPEFRTKNVVSYLSKWIRQRGLVRRQPVESLRVHPIVWRPFRRIRWECWTANSAETVYQYSLIDEQLASIAAGFDERLLLWRPRYAELQPVTASADEPVPATQRAVRDVIKDLLQQRATAQDLIGQVRPQLHRLQADSLSPLGLVVPPYPFRAKRVRRLAEEYRPAAALLLATTLVTNCATDVRIEAGVPEDRIGVGTIVGECRELETRATRLVVLETPGTQTLRAALNAGRGLTRLCELSERCRASLRSAVSSRVSPNS